MACSRSAAFWFFNSRIRVLRVLRSSRSIVVSSSLHVLSWLVNAVQSQMQHEHLQDVAAASLFVSAPWLCLVLVAVVGMLHIACPFWRAFPLLSLVAVLLVLMALRAQQAGQQQEAH